MELVNMNLKQGGYVGIDEIVDEKTEDIVVDTVCARAAAIDFTVKEYPINTEIYTLERNKEYKEAFLQVLLNQIPIQYEDGTKSYFKEIDSEMNESSYANYIKIIKKAFEYYYFDFDQDGLPELIIESCIRNVDFGGPRILKYDADSKQVHNFGDNYRWTDWKPLCSGKLYYEDETSGMFRYGYQELDSLGKVVDEVSFFYTPQSKNDVAIYMISVDEFEQVEVDTGSWEKITHDFFESESNAVTSITFDELFSDI